MLIFVSCSLNALDSSHSLLPMEIQKEIEQNILLLLKGMILLMW